MPRYYRRPVAKAIIVCAQSLLDTGLTKLRKLPAASFKCVEDLNAANPTAAPQYTK